MTSICKMTGVVVTAAFCITSSWGFTLRVPPNIQVNSPPTSTNQFIGRRTTAILSTDEDTENKYTYDDSGAESQFGTKEYWDDMYIGMGDFDSEEYSWYFGFDTIKPIVMEYMPLPPKKQGMSQERVPIKTLVPGVGNDGTLLDLYNFGYDDIVAFDYSSNAIERQRELLSFNSKAVEDIELMVRDARELDDEWTEIFDVIFEKGALDAVFLSGKGNVEKAVQELKRVIKKGGYFMSISGVVPEELRREMFLIEDWEWIRDGSNDLKAGCFVWKRR
mmetsp:Transcript_24993/g.37007  ORF Transcript_24993/g.37007 Transcript_24993/m.37007 type:complete len:276 (+) Transcript_24993:115-942(+)